MMVWSVSIGGVRIGAVSKFVGEPAASRWLAGSTHPTDTGGSSRKFATRSAAVAWLIEQHEEAGSLQARLSRALRRLASAEIILAAGSQDDDGAARSLLNDLRYLSNRMMERMQREAAR